MARGICWKPGRSGIKSSGSSGHQKTFHPHPRIQSVAEPILLQTDELILTHKSAAPCTINGSECALPGSTSRDDDEDSSPLVQDLDLAEHVPYSNCDMTTLGHDDTTLTLVLGASSNGRKKL